MDRISKPDGGELFLGEGFVGNQGVCGDAGYDKDSMSVMLWMLGKCLLCVSWSLRV